MVSGQPEQSEGGIRHEKMGVHGYYRVSRQRPRRGNLRCGARRRLDGGALYGDHNDFPDSRRFGGNKGGRGWREGIGARKKGMAVFMAEGERG